MSRRRPLAQVLLVCTAAIVAATCDAATAVAPPYAEPVVLTFTGDTVVVVGRTIAPAISAELRGEPVTNARFRLLSADTSVIAITARQDSIAGRRRGCAMLTVRLENALVGDDGPSIAQRVCAVVAEVTIDRTSLDFVSIGDTATLFASAVDGLGNPVTGLQFQWRSTDEAIAEVGAAGRVTARGEGSAEIEAIADGFTASIPVGVAQRLAGFTFAPAAVVFDAFTAETTVVATARDARGFAMTGTVAIWESRDTTIASVSPTGVVTARANGVTHVLGRREAIVDSLRVEVRQRADRVVISSVAGFAIDALGDELLLSGRAFDRLNHPIGDVAPVWTSSAPSVAEVLPDRGLVTGLSIGQAPILATVDGVADTALVDVRNVPVSLELVPGSVTLTSLGDQLPFQVIAVNRRGASIPNLAITWRSTDPLVLGLTSSGLATALSTGTSSVIASADVLADTAGVIVENRPASIAIIPTSHTFQFVGDTLRPAAEIRNARGDLLDRTSVTWSSEDESVASVTSTGGLVTAREVGSTWIRAVYGALRDSMDIIVRNDPATVVLNGTLDTLTAVGQQLQYVADVRNARGDVLSDPPQWTTTDPGVATVTAGGLMTGVGYGTASVIATAGMVADTVTVVVTNPTRIHVDNAVVVTPRLGTLARPFTSIQAAISVADAYDTVLVRPGITPYSETVALSRRVTLLGDSTAYLANGRNPMRLPVITHDTGSAGIVAHTRAPVTVRYFTILHSVDGAAVDVFESDAQLEYLYVNPGVSGIRIGRGILIRDVASAAVVANSTINAVAGYAIRVDNSRNVRIAGARVTAVGSTAGESGAGIHLLGGEGHIVELSRVRGTAGPHILADTSRGLRIADNDLAGRHQLVRLIGAAGTQISRNLFTLSLQPEDPGATGSETDGRSGVELREATDVTVDANVFTEPGTRLMDAVRLIDARSPSGTAVRLQDNRFHRGRHSVRSERSTWEMLRSRSDSALLAVVTSDADSLTLVDDTLAASVGGRCLVTTGASSAVIVTRGVFDQCSPIANAVGEPAVDILAANASLDMSGVRFSGRHQTAIRFSGRRLSVRNSDVVRTAPATATSFSASGVIDGTADTVHVAGTTIGQHAMLAGITATGGHVQLDSNRVTRNATGIRIGAWTSLRVFDNDIFDNTGLGLLSTGGATIDASDNWWGDALGPRRSTDLAAAGDSIAGAVTFDPVRAEPLTPGAGAAQMLKIRGDNQTVPRNTVVPIPLTVRIVDAQGRPVAGVLVTFTTGSGGTTFVAPTTGSTIVVTTDASGLAKATMQMGSGTGSRSATVSAPGTTGVTFTVTGT